MMIHSRIKAGVTDERGSLIMVRRCARPFAKATSLRRMHHVSEYALLFAVEETLEETTSRRQNTQVLNMYSMLQENRINPCES
jgi:hypothetical protein